jgi:cell division protein FtsI/penicillin-binding protein 2
VRQARAVIVVVTVGTALLAAGCSGSSNSSSSPTPTTVPQATTVTTTTATTRASPDDKAAQSSIDARVQTAAERAIVSVAQPVDIIAIRASTGAILAYAGRGGGLTAADALTGWYPTGSVF